MSFVARNNLEKGDDYRSYSSLYEDDNADQHEEYQSTPSELPDEIPDSQPNPYLSAEIPDSQPEPYLPAEIPDSQPDPYLPAEIPDSQPDPYLPAEIPDSQPDLVYHADLPFGYPDYSEVSSHLTNRDHRDLQLGNASAFDPRDYDLGEEEAVDPGDLKLGDQKEFNSSLKRFERFHREEVDESVDDDALSSSSSGDTEIIPGGTRLTERLRDRLVSFFRHSLIPV